MIERFVAALRETELELDWRDIADVLWLADVRARDAASESGEPPADGLPASAELTAKPRETGGPATSDAADASPVPTEPVGPREVTPVRPAGWRLTERIDADNSGGAGLGAVAPTSYALPGGMEIGRALRPMKQQRRTPRRKVFDPEATIDLFCDTGVLVPVLRTGSERWFDVAVVADTSATMAVWDDTVAALADLLERHGAFRGVTRWALAERDGAIEVLSPSGLAHRPHELLDLAGRRLVLVVTDAVDALWARAPVWEALRAWGEYGPVALVQVLPPRSWPQTRLGEADAAVASSRPGQPNHQLEVVPPWWWLEGEPPDHAVPVVGLDEASLSPWARMVMGAPGVSVPGVLAVPEDGIDGGASGQVGLPGEVDLDRLGNVLRSTVSAQAYRLAVLLSAVEVSLPIARIVMHELMPHTRLAHLAELIAAGVLKAARLPAPGIASADVGAGAPLPAAAPGGRADRSQVALTFAPGLRELFQRSLTVTMTLQVWRAVAPYLEATHGLRRFSLLLQPSHAEFDAVTGADELREGLQAIAVDLADRLGLIPSPAVAARLGLMRADGIGDSTAEPGKAVLGNPFKYGSPIRDPRKFFGRTREVEQIFARIRNEELESSSVVGDRRTGKTSLLNYLTDPGVRVAHGLPAERYIFVYADLQMVSEEMGPEQLWRRLLVLIRRHCPDGGMVEILADSEQREQLDTFVLDELFQEIDDRGLRVVFLLDEFERVTENVNFGPDFYYGLRSLIIHHKIAAVTTTRLELIALTHLGAIKSSPFFNIFANINLLPFSDGDFRLMISRSLSGTDVQFSEAELEQVLDLAGLHPYFLQAACSMLWESHRRNLDEAARSSLLVEQFHTEALPRFAGYWDHSDDYQKIVLTTAALLEQTRKPMREFSTGEFRRVFPGGEPAVERLEKRGLLASRGGRYRLFSSLLGPWILQQIRAEPSEEKAYHEWLATNAGLVERITGERGGPLRDILPKIRPRYRNLVLTWASDPQAQAAVTGLLENVLGPAKSSVTFREPNRLLNPYIAGSPVTGTEMFYGREDVFSFIQRNLTGQHRDTPIVLYGQRRTGKTSVLYQLHRHLDPSYLCIFIDMHGLSLNGMENLLMGIANSISRELRRNHRLTVDVPDRPAFLADPRLAFETMFLEGVWSAIGEDHLILMMDEVVRLDEEVRAGRLEREVFDYLRHLMQHHTRLIFIFSLGAGLEEMAKDYAFLFSVSLYHRISYLEPAAAHELITRPVRDNYLVTPQAASRILQITSGHPYYTQLVCHCLFDLWSRSPKPVLDVADVDAVLAEAIELGSANLTYLWEDSTPGEQAMMAGMSAAMQRGSGQVTLDQVRDAWREVGVALPSREVDQALRSLTVREVVAGSEAYSFTVDLLRLWLERHRRLGWVKEELAETLRQWN